MDARFVQRVLSKIHYDGTYTNLVLGHDLLNWIHDHQKSSLPGLVLLDIGLPGISGKEVLTELRRSPETMAIPVIMMSGSNSQRDYHECIELGANGYIQKTADQRRLTCILHHFIEGWSLLSDQEFF